MDRNEAIELLKNMHWSITTKMNREVPSSLALLMAIEALDKDTNVPNKWIPVSEKLPEEDGIYLVSGGGKVWSAQCLTFGCFRGWSNDARNPAVIAWMPLPEPYKEGEENENVN